jgi:hypothetical protein
MDMADFTTIRYYFDEQKVRYFSWYGGDRLHREYPEEERKEISSLSCCTLNEGECPHAANYRCCSHEKGGDAPEEKPEICGRKVLLFEICLHTR